MYRGDAELEPTRHTYQSEDYMQQVLAFTLEEGATVGVSDRIGGFRAHMLCDRGRPAWSARTSPGVALAAARIAR